MRKNRQQAGLTLMELMVAMAVLSVLFVAIYNLFSSGLKNSMESSTRADLDAQTQKVQQLVLSRLKEADKFVSASSVTFSDSQAPSSTAYLPASTLTASQIVIVRVPSKATSALCDLYAYYIVPASNLMATTLPLQRRLNVASSGAYALIQGKAATSYTCSSGSYPNITSLSVLHPSLANSNGFSASVYSIAGMKRGMTLILKGYQKVGSKTISTNTYQTKVLARNCDATTGC
ncbi:PulJ/GspJ family protein [Deinococcus roseus]|uniref:Prepilin-type cleavage/methylation domain-containing protein n=1 Tax=Deinococcus roseus TaxID=392414 RepID=A0ABQ2CXV7_9DEIO|nr:prepilin-type N-terminal cleavage/methylation domain-containing protein [Deinococcus roseus]GGJ27930.1 hypothetical protein GCM10008938_12500 [Deinococcus roseus]